MNLLLVDPAELDGSRLVLGGRHAEHVFSVLGKKPGETLQCGVAGRGRGTATVIDITRDRIELEIGELTAEAPSHLDLVVALPRPKALSRLIQTIASLGVGRLDLIGAYRVEKSYFDSPRLEPERLREDLWLGAEQGVTSQLPEVQVTRGFGAFLNETLPELERARPALGFVLHPTTKRSFGDVELTAEGNEAARSRLVIGPEGGFTEGELRALERHGFTGVGLGAPVLKTEAAVVAAWAQWSLQARVYCAP